MRPNHSRLWAGILSAALGTVATCALATSPAAAAGALKTITIGIYPGNTSQHAPGSSPTRRDFTRARGWRPSSSISQAALRLRRQWFRAASTLPMARPRSASPWPGNPRNWWCSSDFAEYINWGIVVAKDKASSSVSAGFPANVKSLKGLKIGVAALGGVAEKFVLAVLESAGLKPGDVTMIAVGAANTAIPALKNGRVDALAAIVSQQTLKDKGVDAVTVVDAGIKGNAGPAATNVLGWSTRRRERSCKRIPSHAQQVLQGDDRGGGVGNRSGQLR